MDDLSGRIIRSYRLERPIGSGGFGAVYSAHQSVVNREVAIKVILPNYANHPDFIRRFEVEAQLVASVEHPHIVPLYDFWREPDGAYLVMRLLRAGSLRSSLRSRTWGINDVIQMLDQIAAALNVAHRHGVIHRDLKPDNILLDEDGNAYLSDFGTAADLIGNRSPVDSKTVMGSPEYMSPEQILRQPVTPQTDIYSLGIVLYEILTGQRPFTGDSVTSIVTQQVNDPLPPLRAYRADLPAQLSFVLWRATAKLPEGRYLNALALAQDFREAAAQKGGPLPLKDTATSITPNMGVSPAGTIILKSPDEPINPYKGLRAFEETDAHDFFGREANCRELLAKMETQIGNIEDKARFLAIVGPSGSGKSSLVRAGLIPAFRRGDLSGSDNWFIATMTPGSKPIEELAQALLSVASNPVEGLLDQLEQDEVSLHQAVEQILPDKESTLVLIIDQFEEIFTLVEDEAERIRFLNSLYEAVTAHGGCFWTIITLRADFYDRPLLYSGLGSLIRKYTEVVLPLSPEELERAITGPAERAGLALEPGLAASMVADVSRQPGALPLLQFALTELFEKRTGQTLTLEAYQTIGGVLGALARRADELYQELNPSAQEMTRKLFLGLVTIDEAGEVTRKRASWSEWKAISGGNPESQQIIDTFLRFRLLTLDRDPVTRAPTIQLAHEALIREWKRLHEWISSSRDDLRVHRQLTVAVNEWIDTQRDSSFLASGTRLIQFEGLAASHAITLGGDETAYLQSSLALRKQTTNRRRLFILSLIVLSVAALLLAVFAFDRQNTALVERDRADQQQRVARSRELSATALLNQPQPDLSLLLSLASLRTADTFEAQNSLLAALQSNPRLETYLRGHMDAVRTVAFSPDGRWLASGGRDSSIILWDITTYAPAGAPLTGHTGWVNSVAYSPDGGILVSGSADKTVRVWDVQTREPIGNPLVGHSEAVWSVAFSPDGKTILSGGADHTLRLWDVASQTPVGEPLLGHEDAVYSVAFSPDGNIIASGGADNTVRLWDAQTRQSLGNPLMGHTNWVLSVAFSPDGKLLASSGADSTIILWDVKTRQPIMQIASGHNNWVRSLAFSPDGQTLISASADGTSRLWGIESGQMIGQPYAGHQDAIWSARFSPDGRILATASADTTVMLWRTEAQPALLMSLYANPDAVASVAFSPDNTLLAAAGGNQLEAAPTAIQLWDMETGTRSDMPEGHTGPITDLAFSPDGQLMASAGADHTIVVWDVKTRQLAQQLVRHTDVVRSVVFSPDRAIIASGGDDGSVKLWNIQTGQVIDELRMESGAGITDVAFNTDGSILAYANRDNMIVLWDVSSRKRQGTPLVGHTDAITSLAFVPNTTFLISGSRDATLILWDIEKRQPVGRPFVGHQDWVLGLAVSPDGRMLASGSRDHTTMLWDIASGQPLGEPLTGHHDWVNAVTFSPDSRLLASGSNDTLALIWDVSLQSWQERACAIANRDFSEDEIARFSLESSEQHMCQSW